MQGGQVLNELFPAGDDVVRLNETRPELRDIDDLQLGGYRAEAPEYRGVPQPARSVVEFEVPAGLVDEGERQPAHGAGDLGAGDNGRSRILGFEIRERQMLLGVRLPAL